MAVWTEERVELFKQMHADGNSFSAIAAALGLTRNACIGKSHRLGLTPRRMTPQIDTTTLERRMRRALLRRQRAEQQRLRRQMQGCEPSRRESLADLPVDISKNPKRLLELEDHHCRWPLSGSGMNALFCGDATLLHSYCERHCLVAYRVPDWRRVKQTPAPIEQCATGGPDQAQARSEGVEGQDQRDAA